MGKAIKTFACPRCKTETEFKQSLLSAGTFLVLVILTGGIGYLLFSLVEDAIVKARPMAAPWRCRKCDWKIAATAAQVDNQPA